MLKRRSSMPSSRASTRTWPAISPAVRLRSSPIFPVRQNAHFIAHPTCVEMQKVWAGVSGMIDRLDVFAVRKAQQEFRGPVDRSLLPLDDRRRDQEVGCQVCPKLARQVAHLREISDSALVNPLKDLAGVKTRMPEAGERTLELGQLGLRDVDSGIGGHDRRRRCPGLTRVNSHWY